MSNHDPLEPLTISDVARILGKSADSIYHYIKSGNLRAIKRYEGQKRPQRLFIVRQDLERFIYGSYNNYDNRKKVTLVSNSK
jgi:hypothetical protein